MSDAQAPERVWLDWPGVNRGEPIYENPPKRADQPGQTGYVREDLHTALQARLAEVEADKRWIMDDRDRTFDLMLSRAEAAEARVKVLEEALRVINALDPERHIDGCSADAARGLVLRMGELARAALAAMEGRRDE